MKRGMISGMEKSNYRGETLSKKYARFKYWANVMGRRKGQFLRSDRFLVIPSQFCGDVSCLTGFGVHPSRIVAVDVDPEAIRICKDRFPGVEAICDDVGEWAKRSLDVAIDVSLLDFCGHLTRDQINCVRKVVRRHGDQTQLGIVLLRAREKGGLRDEVAAQRAKALSAARAGQRPNDSTIDPSRYTTLALDFFDWGFDHGVGIVPWCAIAYQSIDDSGNGSPMQMVAFEVVRSTIRHSRKHFKRDRRKFGELFSQRHSKHWMSGGVESHARFDPSEEMMRAMILSSAEELDGVEFESDGGAIGRIDVAKVFCIDRGQLSAWKAHASRQTYGACKICVLPEASRSEAARVVAKQLLDEAGFDREIGVGGLCAMHEHVVGSKARECGVKFVRSDALDAMLASR